MMVGRRTVVSVTTTAYSPGSFQVAGSNRALTLGLWERPLRNFKALGSVVVAVPDENILGQFSASEWRNPLVPCCARRFHVLKTL